MSHPHSTSFPESPSAQLDAVVAMAAYPTADTFRWDGRTSMGQEHRPRFVRAGPSYPAIVAQLGQKIYEAAYIRRDEGRGAYQPIRDLSLQRTFLLRLSEAQGDRGTWTPGWRKIAGRDGVVEIQDATGRRLQVAASEFEEGADGTGIARIPTVSDLVQPGWYHVRGHRDRPYGSGPGIRLYWNLSPAGAVPFIHAATRALDEAGCAFHLKVLDDPQHYNRADAAVVYLPSNAWEAVEPAVRQIHSVVRSWLKATVPLLTQPLAPGVAVADDPGGDESFGMHRSRIVAEGLWDAYSAGKDDEPTRREHVRERFRRERLDPDHPQCGPGLAAPVTSRLVCEAPVLRPIPVEGSL